MDESERLEILYRLLRIEHALSNGYPKVALAELRKLIDEAMNNAKEN